jgi:hypothetical protein
MMHWNSFGKVTGFPWGILSSLLPFSDRFFGQLSFMFNLYPGSPVDFVGLTVKLTTHLKPIQR